MARCVRGALVEAPGAVGREGGRADPGLRRLERRAEHPGWGDVLHLHWTSPVTSAARASRRPGPTRPGSRTLSGPRDLRRHRSARRPRGHLACGEAESYASCRPSRVSPQIHADSTGSRPLGPQERAEARRLSTSGETPAPTWHELRGSRSARLACAAQAPARCLLVGPPRRRVRSVLDGRGDSDGGRGMDPPVRCLHMRHSRRLDTILSGSCADSAGLAGAVAPARPVWLGQTRRLVRR